MNDFDPNARLARLAGPPAPARSWSPTTLHLVAVAAVLVLAPVAPAQRPVQGTDNHTNLKGWALQQHLNEQHSGPPQARPPLNTPSAYVAPRRSTLQASVLPYKHPDPKPVAYVTAHLPMGADLWVLEELMFTNVQKPEVLLVTPPLEKDTPYTYTARVRWLEDGKWVGQMHSFVVRGGEMHHLEVTPSTAPSVQREIAAGLAKLSPDDRGAAEKQKFCAVQETIRLGSMGPPVKVAIGGKDVYLCCKGCEDAAKKNPEKTLEKVQALKDGKADPAK